MKNGDWVVWLIAPNAGNTWFLEQYKNELAYEIKEWSAPDEVQLENWNANAGLS